MRHLWIVLGALASSPAQKWSWNGCAPAARARDIGKSYTKNMILTDRTTDAFALSPHSPSPIPQRDRNFGAEGGLVGADVSAVEADDFFGDEDADAAVAGHVARSRRGPDAFQG
jgi:hypothetical protein